MTLSQLFRCRAAGVWRACWPLLFVVAGAVTCDSPTSLGNRASLNIEAVIDPFLLTGFSGLSVDSVRITVIRPPSHIVKVKTFPFDPESTQVSATMTINLENGSETFDVTLEYLSGTTILFTGSTSVDLVAGSSVSAPPPTSIPLTFTGPGQNIASIQISPRDTGMVFGNSQQFTVTARDGSNNPVTSFYVSWRTGTSSNAINPSGLFTAGTTRGQSWVVATTPTGIKDSTRIQVSPTPSQLTVISGNNQSATVGSSLPQPLTVKVLAADNLPVQGTRVQFTPPSGGQVNPSVVYADSLGLATTSATLGSSIGSQSFTASVSGVTPVSFNQNATAGIPTHLAFTVQPTNATAGVVIAPAIQVAAQDAGSNTAASFTGNVTIALGANPGGGTLGGTLTAAAVAGVATFNNLSLDKAGAGYTLTASNTVPGLTGATSGGFNITAGAATTLALVSGNNQSGQFSQQLAAPIVVKVTDAFGNPFSGKSVTFAVTSGGGSLGTPTSNTNASGTASTTWTLGPSGTQALSVTSAGLAGSPLTVSASTAPMLITTVAPHLDTLTAIGATFTLVATTKDSANNTVAATKTWVSRTPAAATVNGSGVVTAVANGSTYVVASDSTGGRDSALIVVEQRIATVNVTPANKGIYLQGTYQFSAAAVDGNGHPVAGSPVFTWSSTSTSVATVNASTGLVSAVTLGNTQIRAQTGTIIGVANVSIITPITRIAVVVDTVNAARTDTFTLTSLGFTRRYRAIAHDTLDAVMTGINFTWVSSNGSVAVLDSITGTTARATSAANGFTEIKATAQGFTSSPGASLTVAQVLASIELKPDSVVIGANGNVGLVARGKDANNRYISGGTFAFASDNTPVATVNASTGLVSGIANGVAHITATSGAITSNQSTITVGGAVPAVLSFGRDTLSIGRGQVNQSIPIYLSKPAASDMIVKLAVQDTFAFWSTLTVTIPAGQTSVNASLNGHNAGTTTVTASDSTGLGYAQASAVLAVTATMQLASGGYAINANDIVATQVLLSDPSPAGGTYVTFAFSTPGIASISPNPAFIPAGQLAADIQIRGLAGGNTNITPQAIGVNGTASSFTAYPPNLTFAYTFARVGSGQYDAYYYVYTPTYGNLPVTVTLTSSDTNVARVPPSIQIAANNNYQYFAVIGSAPGSATITMSSPGWTAVNSMSVVVTTPRVGVCCGGNRFTTSPTETPTIYAEDSTASSHYRVNSLVVRVRSSDTTVMRVLDTLVTIAPNNYYTQSARIQPAGNGGSAYIVVTASGHTADSTLYTIQGPPLNVSWGGRPLLGAGQYDNQYVYTPNSGTVPVVVHMTSSDSNIVSVDTTVTIPQGTNYVYFSLRAKAPGDVTINFTAPGYNAVSGNYRVTTPHLLVCCGGTYNNFRSPFGYTVYATDSTGSAHYRLTALTVTGSSTDTTVLKTDTLYTIGANAYYTNPVATPVNVGTATIAALASGHVSNSQSFTVVTPKLNFDFYNMYIGRRQQSYYYSFYVYTPDSRSVSVPVTLTQLHGTVDSLDTTTPVIAANNYYQYFQIYGLTNGVDTIIATAAGYVPDTAYVQVTTPKFTTGGLPGSTTTTNPPIGVYVYATDSLGSGQYTMDTVTVTITSSDSNVIRPEQQYVHIPKGDYYTVPLIDVLGPGTANLTFSDSANSGYLPVTSNTITVTGPSLTLSNSAPMLGMRQHEYNSYVYTPNNVNTPLVVNLVSTDTRVVTVPATVTIPVNNNYAYFTVTAHDTVGTIQVQATATGYGASAMNVQVTPPHFVVSTSTQLNTTSAPSTLTIYATDQNGSGHYVNEDVSVTLLSSAPGVASFGSSTVTIVQDQYYTQRAHWLPGSTGTAQLQFSDQRAVQYKYNTANVDVSVVTPTLANSWNNQALGIGQYVDQYVYRPDYPPVPLDVSLSHTGTARTSTPSTVQIPANTNYVYFRITGTTAGTDTLVMSASSPPHNPSTGYTVVDLGRIDPIGGWPGSIKAGDSVQVTLYARDQNTTTHYVAANTTFTLAPNANIQFTSGVNGSQPLTQITIPADGYYVQFYLKGVSPGAGSANITATNYSPYSNTVTVTP